MQMNLKPEKKQQCLTFCVFGSDKQYISISADSLS